MTYSLKKVWETGVIIIEYIEKKKHKKNVPFLFLCLNKLINGKSD